MKNTNTMNLSSEVNAALKKYNTAVESALEAVQKLESIAITKRLSEMFAVKEEKAARLIQEDYLIAA